MLEEISAPNSNQSQEEQQRHDPTCTLTDEADEELQHLRIKNTALAKHGEKLEKTANFLCQTEAELCEIRILLNKEQDMSKQRDKMIQRFETVNSTLRQQNDKITDKLDSLQAQIEQDKFSLLTMKTSLRNLQREMEETQLELQHKDDVISQKSQVLKQLEKSTEDCMNFLKELRMKNQELKDQLADRQEDALWAEMIKGSDEPIVHPLSLPAPQDIDLLTPSAILQGDLISEQVASSEVPATGFRSRWFRRPNPRSWVSSRLRFPKRPRLGIPRVGRFLLGLIVVLAVVVVVSWGLCPGTWPFFSFDTLWNRIRTLIQPYCNVHYSGLPPI